LNFTYVPFLKRVLQVAATKLLIFILPAKFKNFGTFKFLILKFI